MSDLGMQGDEVHIGGQIRNWRKKQGMTLSDLAVVSGLSMGYVSQVERGLANPSISSLKRLVDALGRTVADLFRSIDGEGGASRVHIARRGKSPRLDYGEGLANELLSPSSNSMMEVFWVEAAAGTISGHDHHAHDGEEFGFILQGQMAIEIGGREYTLNRGDSLYFKSVAPHQWTSSGSEDLRAIWVITPPTF